MRTVTGAPKPPGRLPPRRRTCLALWANAIRRNGVTQLMRKALPAAAPAGDHSKSAGSDGAGHWCGVLKAFLKCEVGFLVQPAVLVADHQLLFGTLCGDQQAKRGGALGKVEFELRGVEVGGFQRRIQGCSMYRRGRILPFARVDEPQDAGVRGESSVLGAPGGDCGLVEARAEGHKEADREGSGFGFYLNHRIGQMAVDFAEILFLAAVENALVTDERKAEKKAEVDDGSRGHEQPHGASHPGLAYEPGDEGSRGGDKGSSAGGEEPEDRCRW